VVCHPSTVQRDRESLYGIETCSRVHPHPQHEATNVRFAAASARVAWWLHVEDHTLSRTYRRSRDDEHAKTTRRPHGRHLEKPFRCVHCKAMVDAIVVGGSHRNHCPYCLHSRHVDGRVPGDRAGTCRGRMAPVGAFLRRNGEHVIVHRCLRCGFERHNRIAADDIFELVMTLPLVEPRIASAPAEPQADDMTA
jgi:DNA-directed RNA polymerase subunit RPC12/RpoP